nr:hypothetical protein Itr_chr05CG10530 [Ipomoea trifida]
MTNDGEQTCHHRALEEQIEQLRVSQQQAVEEFRQALTTQNRALTEAMNTGVADLSSAGHSDPWFAGRVDLDPTR